MSVTYTSALQRDGRFVADTTWRLRAPELFFVFTSLVGLLAIALAYGGRIQKFEMDSSQISDRVTNLNLLSDARQLDPALKPVIPVDADRRLAARELYRAIQVSRDGGGELPNVGAIAHLSRLSAAAVTTLKPFLVVRTASEFRHRVVVNAAMLIGAFYAVLVVWRIRGVRGDVMLLTAAHFLTALGFAIVLSRPDPLRDTLLFERYTQGVCIGVALMALVAFIDFQRAAFLKLSYLPLIGALCLSALLIGFGTGPGTSGAKVNLGPVQPIEAIRLLLTLFLAGYFADRWELLRQIRSVAVRHYRLPAWINLPRAEYVLPVVVGVAAALVFFFLQKDLGPALFLSCVFLAMYGVARNRPLMAVVGFTLLVAGFYIGYRLNISLTLADRVRMWQSPWDNTVHGGDQVAQAIWALATGGLFGTGLGLGDTRYLPAGHTDLVLAALGEELGLIGVIAVFAVYGLIGWRGFRIARSATSEYGFFLAIAGTLFLLLPVLVMGAGLLGITPLTGVVTPFLSYGGSAMVANFVALGMLTAIEVHPGSIRADAPFDMSLRWLGGMLAGGAAILVVALLNIQVLHANEYAVKPHLTVQGDGIRRYQYNQRVLDIARTIVRGTVYDRDGRVLATGDPTLADRAHADYASLAVTPNPTCDAPIERCYPLGGIAFHLLGDASSRINWTASNTSYIEREAEDRLHGFDDRATLVQSGEIGGRPTFAIKRDYRDLLPLLRHRYDRGASETTEFLARTRDVRLTIDARFQVRVSNILADAAHKSPAGKAAAVVLDPDSGDVLAAASYPWPTVTRSGEDRDLDAAALLDRARYGLYPPGSTFKLVTAMAALRQDRASQRRAFTCTRLPDGRVGAQIAGWRRPVRDDVLDSRPHGTIEMREALVRSCNAYFAQLAASIGPEALAETAARLGIFVALENSAERLRPTLPQAGYGQGDVVTTPLKMARVAATIADGGILRAARWQLPDRPAEAVENTEALLAPEAAELLAAYMREAVLIGTGRSLKGSSIAGKTGTAEVAAAPSHSWFVGFAPFGSTTRRIAFAVIIENSGYGSVAAAPVAGEIVAAAQSLGIIQ